MRKNLVYAALFSTLLGSFNAQASSLQAGQQYLEINPAVAVTQPDKIEVVELFGYGCGACFKFEPLLNPWIATLPADVTFKRLPAMFGGKWDVHGQLFLTLEAMRVEPRVHHAMFEAIHKDGKKLLSTAEMAATLTPLGVDKDAFLSTYNSFAVVGQVATAKRLTMAYQVNSVPTLIVDGKYRFDARSTGGWSNTLEVADQLIEQQRNSKAALAAQP